MGKSIPAGGIAKALASALLWGISGTFAQYVFEEKHIDPSWLVTMRLLVSGFTLLVFGAFKRDKDFILIWQNKRDVVQLILFAMLGMFAVQYTYFAAIVASNAATATVLQYTGPVFIVVYFAILQKKIPVAIELAAIVLAFTGVFFLVTHGDIHSLAISSEAFVWGISSAVALMMYSILPIPLLQKYSSFPVIGWGMLLGGIIPVFIAAPWNITGIWDVYTFLSVSFIILLGSLAAFYMYITAVKEIGAQTASLLACTEPLAAVLLSVCWLHVSFLWSDWVGTICILITILLLSSMKK
ncbi:DMT family transporter [Cytophaga hutchinsonii]|jgi:drug/metabolite transporter (DMT)-like permease|uniref:Permease, DMT family n=1 Tax=Cytophaga hutchinsonii (strain ATCC 33406 / DSM 1761 / CIP 103989 / NBRC 15051 / NCIMB 9469 / D465) TaxID=269798 RepID=A0A6N4ST13_CYTH3|nr:EamA family transporter [Cytophaga hutchinsonii]ABG59507.1 permease, DMT family [Cytophaga hutchinsonii ATCC 33406]SFX94410.1 Threonine/homoserine efflux transporter RhtA [Cytophaga hutchinsonii ATCC 33406]